MGGRAAGTSVSLADDFACGRDPLLAGGRLLFSPAFFAAQANAFVFDDAKCIHV